MALDNVPWFVGGGAEHSPEVARELVGASTSGARGVAGIRDFQPTPLPQPGTSLRLLSGGYLIPNDFPGGAGQSYAGRAGTATDVPIAASGSGGARNDLVVIRVNDPQYTGASNPDPDTFQYADTYVYENVADAVVASAGAAQAYLATKSVPAIAIAGVKMPASTATVGGGAGNGTIVDLRQIPLPKRDRERRIINLDTGTQGKLTATAGGGEVWPNTGSMWIDVPIWATKMLIRMDWVSVVIQTASGGNTAGYAWVEYGPYISGSEWEYGTNLTRFNSPNGASGTIIVNITNADSDRTVPPEIRGKRIRFIPKGRITNGTAPVFVDEGSAMILDVEFFQSPEQYDPTR